jgi:hypothetical protein
MTDEIRETKRTTLSVGEMLDKEKEGTYHQDFHAACVLDFANNGDGVVHLKVGVAGVNSAYGNIGFAATLSPLGAENLLSLLLDRKERLANGQAEPG